MSVSYTHLQESDFFSHTIHDDLDSIVQDIRQAHVTDHTTANPQPTFTEVKEKFDRAMQLGSNEERVIHEFCDQMQMCIRDRLGVVDMRHVREARAKLLDVRADKRDVYKRQQ